MGGTRPRIRRVGSTRSRGDVRCRTRCRRRPTLDAEAQQIACDECLFEHHRAGTIDPILVRHEFAVPISCSADGRACGLLRSAMARNCLPSWPVAKRSNRFSPAYSLATMQKPGVHVMSAPSCHAWRSRHRWRHPADGYALCGGDRGHAALRWNEASGLVCDPEVREWRLSAHSVIRLRPLQPNHREDERLPVGEVIIPQ